MTRNLNEVVDALMNQASKLQGQYEDIDYGDRDLRTKLLKRAAVRPLTLADLYQANCEVIAEAGEACVRSLELFSRCNERKDDLKVFYVINTSGNKLTVLARDAKCARHFAHQNGHIKEPSNGRVLVMKPENEVELRKSGKALGRALRDGFPGAVSQLGDNVVMEQSNMVYTPMTIVEQREGA